RCGIPFAGLDVFLNVAGGMRVNEPAADLAIAGALLSAREDSALPGDCVLFGEISLSGALRPVAQAENRLKEAQKLGFSQAILPEARKVEGLAGMSVMGITDLTGFVGEVFGAG
ncbi:DNA repair protein RadA, partial [Glutamicibacter soli]|nr:DNA repair protein RadA [Glutamicibacter soli]